MAVLLIASGCREKKAEQFQALPFPAVQLPAMISAQQEALEYLALNYWNGITDLSRNYPSDSVLVSGVRKADLEQEYANWLQILDHAGYGVWERSMTGLYDRASSCEQKDTSSNIFETFVALTQKYLYDPNSPMRDEEKYLHFVRKYAGYKGLTAAEKGKYEREARLCALNRIGAEAADFRFTDRYGRTRNLHDIDSELTLLFFSNPGCEACMNIINMLNQDPDISSLISEGRLSVLNIYIDEDLEAWRSYMPIYPENWYNGFDPDLVIRNESLYNVRAIPSLYLLDRNKAVLMKDVPEVKLMEVLRGFVLPLS